MNMHINTHTVLHVVYIELMPTLIISKWSKSRTLKLINRAGETGQEHLFLQSEFQEILLPLLISGDTRHTQSAHIYTKAKGRQI